MKRRSAATTEKAGDKDVSEWVWLQDGSVIYGDSNTKPSQLVAGFDMDWTLIKTKSGATFPKGADDWVIWDEKAVKAKLQEYQQKGYKIVIFSNQGGIEKGHTKPQDIKKKIQNISEYLGIPLQACLSTAEDKNKKPNRGMWDLFEAKMNGGIKVDMTQSFYCGDAAGRKGPPKDFSDSDLKFAKVLGLQFYTPEQFFLDQKETPQQISSNASGKFDLHQYDNNTRVFKEANGVAESSEVEMIVFCGSPGSGKSTFTQTNLPSYIRVNRDTLKTKEKCLKVAEEELKQGHKVVIDNTNPSKADRKLYIDLAKKLKVKVRCFYFDIPKDLSLHLNEQRALNTFRKHLSEKISKIPIHTWYKNHEKPTTSEGFSEVLTVNFVPKFENDDDKRLFYI